VFRSRKIVAFYALPAPYLDASGSATRSAFAKRGGGPLVAPKFFSCPP
jgi:hypothetical protein